MGRAGRPARLPGRIAGLKAGGGRAVRPLPLLPHLIDMARSEATRGVQMDTFEVVDTTRARNQVTEIMRRRQASRSTCALHGGYHGHMPNLQVRNVPEPLHRILKAKAAAEGSSLSDFVLAELELIAKRPRLLPMKSSTERRRFFRQQAFGSGYAGLGHYLRTGPRVPQ